MKLKVWIAGAIGLISAVAGAGLAWGLLIAWIAIGVMYLPQWIRERQELRRAHEALKPYHGLSYGQKPSDDHGQKSSVGMAIAIVLLLCGLAGYLFVRL